MEVNLIARNWRQFIGQKEYKLNRQDEKPIYLFLDAATYNNLGDQAISLAVEQFLNDTVGKDHVVVINESDIIGYIKSIKQHVRADDVIVLGGGGNMGDLYPRYESIRRLIIRNFPRNKIIIFPQTIDYSDDSYGRRALHRAEKVYGKHKRLIICAREKKTFEILNGFCKNVLLVPDIALYLLNKLDFSEEKTASCGVCLRNDKETSLSVSMREVVLEKLKTSSIGYEEITTSSLSKEKLLTYEARKRAVEEKLKEFATYRLIITDRLHGMIFCILANVPCIAFDNSNHKVLGVYEMLEDSMKTTVVAATQDNFHCYIDQYKMLEATPENLNSMDDAFDELAAALTGNI